MNVWTTICGFVTCKNVSNTWYKYCHRNVTSKKMSHRRNKCSIRSRQKICLETMMQKPSSRYSWFCLINCATFFFVITSCDIYLTRHFGDDNFFIVTFRGCYLHHVFETFLIVTKPQIVVLRRHFLRTSPLHSLHSLVLQLRNTSGGKYSRESYLNFPPRCCYVVDPKDVT